jgi:hypothetical protein
MAKKKNIQKKHKFKHVETANESTRPLLSENSSAQADSLDRIDARPRPRSTPANGPVMSGTRDFRYVVGDMKRIGVMAASLVALEIVLFYLFNHTGFGPAVYSHFKG